MKIVKSLTALLLAVLMIASSCLFVSADGKLSYKKGSTYTIESGVTYTNLTMTSGQNGNTVSGVAMEFNPKDGFIPMTFVAYAGSVNSLKTQYDVATSAKYGYDVVGAVNGSYFTLSKGGLDYANISNGRLTCAHVDQYNREVVAFDKNGNMQSVWSKLEFKLFANGVELPNAIYCINKQYKNYKDVAPYAVYYYDTSCGTYTDTLEAGYEIVCQKMNGTDIKVGKTLTGKVLEVKANTYGTKFESNENIQSDKFVLYVKAESNFAKTLKNLKAGDDVSIQVNETNSAAKAAMENALSTITNVGWLVKNGVDQTRIQSEIGGHGVTMQHRQTVFGQKPDGTYIFLTTEGVSTGADGSLTLRDAADYFISQGCTNVIRMDGGGSSGMYVKNKAGTGSAGYTQESQRAIADAILIVKQSSIPGLGESVAQPEGENVALGKSYTGADASPAGSYSAKLTDGIVSAEMAYNSNWFGYYYNKSGSASNINAPNGIGTAVIDLEEVVGGITDVRVHVWNQNSSGIMAAKSIKLSTSDDGTNFTEIGSLAIPEGTYPDWAYIKTDNISARYVKLELETQGTWTFLNEIEVYADPDYEPAPPAHECVAGANWLSDKNNHWKVCDCGEKMNVAAHDSGKWTITTPAAVGVAGEKELRCTVCKYVLEVATIDPLPEPDPVVATNIALNKTYETATALNGYNASLTDGVAADKMSYSGDNWFAFYNNINSDASTENVPDRIGRVVINLEGRFDISEIKINAIQNDTSGIAIPAYVKVYLSDDGENWGDAIEVDLPDISETTKDNAFVIADTVEGTGSYIKFEIALTQRSYVFINEIEVYGVPNEDRLGDVNGDDKIDSTDYLLVKRSCFGSYKLNASETIQADVDGSGKIDATDYVLIKRMSFGTYQSK